MAEKVKGPKTTRLSSKNQVTIPVAVLAEANIKPGEPLTIEAVGDGVIHLTRQRDPRREAFEQLCRMPLPPEAMADLEELRNEWER